MYSQTMLKNPGANFTNPLKNIILIDQFLGGKIRDAAAKGSAGKPSYGQWPSAVALFVVCLAAIAIGHAGIYHGGRLILPPSDGP